MCFQVCGVDHDALGPGTFSSQRREDTVEYAKAAPAEETVIECLVRPVVFRRVLPLQAVLDNVDNPADDTTIIDAGNTMCQRKMWCNTSHLAFAQQKQITHHGLLPETVNQISIQINRS